MNPVRFLDLSAAYSELRLDIDDAYHRVAASGRYLLGPELELFEHRFAKYVGAPSCVGVGSGLDALVLSLRALGIGPGDEVIVPSHTFVATWLAVVAVGAQPVGVDPPEDAFNISVPGIAAAISPRTAAIMPVHLYGEPADVHAIDDLAGAAGLPVVYDAAQAHGAEVAGLPIGHFGTMTAWSFYPGKNLGALSDGGAISCADPNLAAVLRRLRNYGSAQKYVHIDRGVNSRLDEFQAAFLLAKLNHLDEWNRRRAAVAARYAVDLSNCHGIRMPAVAREIGHAWHLFVIRSSARSQLRATLSAAGIETGIHYPIPPSKQTALAEYASEKYVVAEELAGEVLSLPIGPHLNGSDVDRVIEAVLVASASAPSIG